MTPKEQLLKQLAEEEAAADAAIKAAQSGAVLTRDVTTDSAGARRVSSREVARINLDDVEVSRFESAIFGVADTITIGFDDEITAGIMTAFGSRTYDENILRAQAIKAKVLGENPGFALGGQLVGGLVPTSRIGIAAGIGKTGASGVRRAALEGAAYGAAYGYGAADSQKLFDTERLDDAAMGGLFGAAGGFIISTAMFTGARVAQDGFNRLVQFRQGRSPRISYEFKPVTLGRRAADDAEEGINDLRSTLPGTTRVPGEPASVASRVVKAINRITGRSSDEIENGAVASADEILGKSPKAQLLDKLTAMTPQQAKIAAKKLMDAMESGDLATEPHYRSIMGLDLSQFGDLEKVIPEVAEILYELGEGILDKAKLGSRTVKSYEAMIRQKYGSNISEDRLDDLVDKVLQTQGAATVGKIQMTLAGVQFARVAQDFGGKLATGDREAKTVLAEELSKALNVYVKGQFLLSNAGRELGMTRHSNSLLFKEMPDGSQEVAKLAEMTKKVNESLEKMDADAINELLASTRDLSKLDEITKVLLDPVHAEKVGLYYRARNTATSFLKSTILTPTSLAVNLVGVPIHSWLRNSGARALAEAAARNAGDETSALVLSAQRQASAAVRWEAYKQGTVAFYRRIKWEALGSGRDILGVAGFSKAAQKASASRQAMIAAGYRPPQIREYDLQKRLAVTDIKGFNDKLAARLDRDMPFASFANFLERSGAVALNVVDALGTAGAKIVSGGSDDFGRAWVMTRETYAEMAGEAVKQALKEKRTGDDLARRVQELAEEWNTLPPKEILQRAEQKIISGEGLDDETQLLLRRDYNAEKEADRVLFMDGPQTDAGRTAARFAEKADELAALVTSGGILKGGLIPYISTPTRIIERGLASYTPWAKFTKETADIFKRAESPNATPEDRMAAAMEQARMDIGGTILSAGMVAAATGAITITNGADYQNSANLGGVPPLRVNLPSGGYVEFGRLDPLAMGLAMGGVIGQMWKASQEAGDQYGQDDAIATAMAVAYGGFRDSILNKSYLTGLNKLFEAISSKEEGALGNYMATFYPDTAARLIPFSGVSRQVNEMIAGRATEAAGALDRIAKVIPGMGAYLPARVDALGNEVEANVFGFRAGTGSDDDEITQQMRDLGIDITNLAKADPAGFSLTSEELSELRKIRATEAFNKDGLTMREALAQLFADPAFQNLPDKQMKQDEVVEVMGKFNEPARALFEERNQGYLADREAARSFKLYMSEGLMSRADARREAQAAAEQLGLNPTRAGELD